MLNISTITIIRKKYPGTIATYAPSKVGRKNTRLFDISSRKSCLFILFVFYFYLQLFHVIIISFSLFLTNLSINFICYVGSYKNYFPFLDTFLTKKNLPKINGTQIRESLKKDVLIIFRIEPNLNIRE